MKIKSRRHFLKNVWYAGAFMPIYNPFLKFFSHNVTNSVLPTWTELIEWARWCPSVHNLQPHKIKITSATEAELYYDPRRLLPVGDPHSIFATVAMGIFVEHLSIVAGHDGAKVEIVEVFDPISTQAKDITKFALLKISPANQKEELDKQLILKRKTSRLHYNGKPLREETLSKVKAQAELFGHEFFYSSEKEKVNEVIDMNQKTLFEDLQSAADRVELDHLFRYTKEDAESKKDGLWATCMGFSGTLMKSVFQHHEKWEKGLRKNLLADHYKHSFKGTSTICWFGGNFEYTQDWLTAGRMLSRNWLLLTKEGAYIHPFGSLITNAQAYKKINEMFTQPAEGKKVWLIFRAGYSKEPVRSYRLSTDEIIIKQLS